MYSIPFHVPSVVSGTAPGYGVIGRQRTGSTSLALGTDSLGLASATSPSAGRKLSLNVTDDAAAASKGSVLTVTQKYTLDQLTNYDCYFSQHYVLAGGRLRQARLCWEKIKPGPYLWLRVFRSFFFSFFAALSQTSPGRSTPNLI